MLSKHIQMIVVSLTVAAITATAGVLWAQGNRITALETSQGWITGTLKEIKADLEYHHRGDASHQPHPPRR